jgi:hypothetical protein
MSHIDVCARHAMTHQQAQAAADELASDLAGKFDIDYGWEGDRIHFRTSRRRHDHRAEAMRSDHGPARFHAVVSQAQIEQEITPVPARAFQAAP